MMKMVNIVPVPTSKLARRVQGHAPPQILKLKSFEIAGNVYFSIHFCIFKVFKEGNQVTQNEALCTSLPKVREARASCASPVAKFMFISEYPSPARAAFSLFLAVVQSEIFN